MSDTSGIVRAFYALMQVQQEAGVPAPHVEITFNCTRDRERFMADLNKLEHWSGKAATNMEHAYGGSICGLPFSAVVRDRRRGDRRKA